MDNQSPIIQKASKILSNFFNPLVSLLLYFFYYSYKNYTLAEGLRMFAILLLLVVLPISGWLIYNVKKGKYTNMDVSNRHQRHSLYVFIILIIIIFLLADYFLHQRINWEITMLFILLVLMQISNFWIKSSMHASLNIYVAALFFVLNPEIGIFWLILSLLIGISRIILKRHTPAEVISGAMIAIFVSLAYLIKINALTD